MDKIKMFFYKNKTYYFLIEKNRIKYECVGKIISYKNKKYDIAFNFVNGKVLDSMFVSKEEIVDKVIVNL